MTSGNDGEKKPGFFGRLKGSLTKGRGTKASAAEGTDYKDTVSNEGASAQCLPPALPSENDQLAEDINPPAGNIPPLEKEPPAEKHDNQSESMSQVESKSNSVVNKAESSPSGGTGTVAPDAVAAGPPETSPKAMPWPEPFWSQAVEKLRKEKTKVYKGLEAILEKEAQDNGGKLPDVQDLAEKVLDVAQKEKDVMELNRWSLPIKIMNRDISIRDKLDKIIGYAKVIKDKAQPLIDLDPTGHAKLAWIPFSLVVDVSMRQAKRAPANDVVKLAVIGHETYEDALDAFSGLSLILCRYGEIEQDYVNIIANFELEELDKRLVELYVKVLECLVALVCHFRRSKFEQIIRSVPLAIDDWKGKMKEIRTKDQEVDSLIKVIDSKILRAIQDEVAKLNRARASNGNALKWTSSYNPSEDHKTLLDRASLTEDFPDTAKWIFQDKVFRKWNSSEGRGVRSLWLHGPVGSGKTCLTTRVIEHFLEKSFGSQEQVAYFNCSKSTGSGSETLEILRSIIRQLAWSTKDQQIHKSLLAHWENWQDEPDAKPPKLDLRECQEFLKEFLSRESRVTIIIDALDECANPRKLLEVLQNLELEASQTQSNPAAKCFLSSREEVKVLDQLKFCENLRVRPEDTADDLYNFIQGSVDGGLRRDSGHVLHGDPHLRQRVIDVLAVAGKGAFKWTQLHLALIFPEFSAVNGDDIKTSLDEIEQQASSTYLDSAYDRQEESGSNQLMRLYPTYGLLYKRNTMGGRSARIHAQRALQLALTCRGRLSISLLIGTAAIDPEKDEEPASEVTEAYIERVTSNFLVADEHKMLDFAHISVKEFLQHSFPELFSDTPANIQIAASCLTSLTLLSHKLPMIMDEDNSKRVLTPSECFLVYSVSNWPSHCTQVGIIGRQESPLKRRFYDFMLNPDIGNAYSEWAAWGLSRRLKHDMQVVIQGSKSTPPDPFFAACILGLSDVVEAAIKHRPNVLKSFNQQGAAGLHLAARNCHIDITEMLLAAGADVNIKSYPSKTTPLHEACESGHAAVISVLLKKNSLDLNSDDSKGKTPLALAAQSGHETAVNLLARQNEIKIDTRDAYGRTPLSLAAMKGNEKVVRILVKKAGVELNSKDHVGQTPLSLAARRGHAVVVVALLALDKVDADPKDNEELTPLWWAVQKGHEIVVKELLASGKVDANAKDKRGLTPLLWVAKKGDTIVAKALLASKKVDAIAKDSRGRTPISWAMRNKNEAVVMALLASSKADTDSKGGGRRTPLSATNTASRGTLPSSSVSKPIGDSFHVRRHQLYKLHRVLRSMYKRYYNRNIAMRLRLPTFGFGRWTGRARFDVLLQIASGGRHKWQDVKVEVDVGRMGSGWFTDDGPPKKSFINIPSNSMIVRDLFSFIQRAVVSRRKILIHIVNDELWASPPSISSRAPQNDESLSLSDIFESRSRLPRRIYRSITHVIIAQAFLQLWQGPCSPEIWDKKHIYFFKTEGYAMPDITRPYTPISLDDSIVQMTDQRDEDAMHPHPDICALGILLLEIELGIPIEFMEDYDEDSDIDDYMVAMSNLYKHRDYCSERFVQAVKACLRDEFESDEEDGLLTKIYERVVKPLEDDLHDKLGISTEELDAFRHTL